MIDSIKRISLDLHDSASVVRVKVKRDDTARKICISLRDGGVPYNISEDCYAVLVGKKPDGNPVYIDCTIEGNVIICKLTEQATAVVGQMLCEVKLYSNEGKADGREYGDLLTSAKFNIIVEDTVTSNEDDEDIESLPEYSVLQALISDTTEAINGANEAISGANEAAELANEVAAAVLEAKKSGEFKGDPGYTPQKGVDYFDGVSVTHEWSGTTLKVKSASGESSSDLKGDKGDPFKYSDFTNDQLAALKGDPGYTPVKGVDYFDGVSVTHEWSGTTLKIKSASGESSADLKGEKGDKGDYLANIFTGSNDYPYPPVGTGCLFEYSRINFNGKEPNVGDLIFTDAGTLFVITNPSINNKTKLGADCVAILKGDPGYTPVKGVDYVDGYTPVKGEDYVDGRSVFYYTKTMKATSGFTTQLKEIDSGDREVNVGDLLITKNGWLYKIVEIRNTVNNPSFTAEFLSKLADIEAQTRSIYNVNIAVTDKGDTICGDVTLDIGDKTLKLGDLLISPYGYIYEYAGESEYGYHNLTYLACVGSFVKTINGVKPDSKGNVKIEAGGVQTVNGVSPDANGNVEIEAGGDDVVWVTVTDRKCSHTREQIQELAASGKVVLLKNDRRDMYTYYLQSTDAVVFVSLQSGLGASLDAYCLAVGSDGNVSESNFSMPADAVRWYVTQTMPEENKAIARSNIGAAADAEVIKTVNGQAPDASGNVEIAGGGSGITVTAKPGQLIRVKEVDENGNPTSWEAAEDMPWVEGEVVHPLDPKYLPEGVPYLYKDYILEETDLIESTDPTFGKIWGIPKAPMLTVGDACTIVYNGVSYDCVCKSISIPGIPLAPDTVGIGNYSVIGGENTGEPFAMLVTPSLQGMSVIDLSGATSVRIGIMGKVGNKMDDRCIPDSTRVLVVKFSEREDGNLVSTSHTRGQIIKELRRGIPVVGNVEMQNGFSTVLLFATGSDGNVVDVYNGYNWYHPQGDGSAYGRFYVDGDTSNKTIGNEIWEKGTS